MGLMLSLNLPWVPDLRESYELCFNDLLMLGIILEPQVSDVCSSAVCVCVLLGFTLKVGYS